MFEDSLLESGHKIKTKQGRWTSFTFVVEAILVGFVILIPYIFTEALPKSQLATFLIAPPPPPPPPPPPAAPVKVVKVQTEVVSGQLRTPTKIPEKIGSSVAAVPKVAVSRMRVSSGVTAGLLMKKVEPAYPPLAKTARVQGVVVLHAIISKEGTITGLTLVSGPAMLAPAAIDAVKQWRYKPYLLNGEPIELDTTVEVHFNLGG